jgi:hypothetical protein
LDFFGFDVFLVGIIAAAGDFISVSGSFSDTDLSEWFKSISLLL